MCVVIVKPRDKKIPYSHLRTANVQNPHGWGIAARTRSGKILVERGFSSNALIRAYRKFEDKDLVVHCRIGTSGKLDLSNTHPFPVADNTYMFHNGIFSDIKLTTPGRSDTWHLAEMLAPLFEDNPTLLKDETFKQQMEKYCTQRYSNKLVFMDSKQILIINQKAGVTRNGCWYSNYTAFPVRRVRFRPLRPTKSSEPRVYEADFDEFVETLESSPDQAKWDAYIAKKYGDVKGVRVG